MRFLLDTCVLSELWKPRPNAGVTAWITIHDEHCVISILSLGEIHKGIAKKASQTGLPQTALLNWLNRIKAEKQFATFPLDDDVIALWGDICGHAEAQGQALPVIDSLIAATAITHNLTVATRNTVNFERCGVKFVNPWE